MQGEYSDDKIERLTQREILKTINTKNVSQIFLKEFNFKHMLGDIRYNSRNEIVGAGAVEIKFFTKVNISLKCQHCNSKKIIDLCRRT